MLVLRNLLQFELVCNCNCNCNKCSCYYHTSEFLNKTYCAINAHNHKLRICMIIFLSERKFNFKEDLGSMLLSGIKFSRYFRKFSSNTSIILKIFQRPQ